MEKEFSWPGNVSSMYRDADVLASFLKTALISCDVPRKSHSEAEVLHEEPFRMRLSYGQVEMGKMVYTSLERYGFSF